MGTNRAEYAACATSPAYLIDRYIWIEDATAREWVPFRLWRSQYEVLTTLQAARMTIILKARQLGLTWLALSYALWMMVFRPGSVILLFSMRDDEATELLTRLSGMHGRLPPWLRQSVLVDNDHELAFGNGSRARAFPTTKKSGRSFTATLAIVDEADYIQWFARLMTAVKPTIDAGGGLILLSTSNKEEPESEFKRIWREAIAGRNSYAPIFLPWGSRPDRDSDWYERQKADYTQDDLWQEYPATPEQALAQRESAARFSAADLDKCFQDAPPIQPAGAPALPGLTVYHAPRPATDALMAGRYLISCDTSEGDLTSDYSPAIVWDMDSWEEVAHITGRFEPSVLARYLARLGDWYNQAVICVERNNHGHAVDVALREMDAAAMGVRDVRIYKNPFDDKHGWLSNAKYKTLAVNWAAEVFRDGACAIHSRAIMTELIGIQAATLAALEGMHDDNAMAAIIGLAALHWGGIPGTAESTVLPPADPLAGLEF